MDHRLATRRLSSRRSLCLVVATALFALLPGCGGGGSSGSSTTADAGDVPPADLTPLPAALLRVSAASSTGACHVGASRVQAGIDADGDGQLGDAEVQATAEVCTEGSSAPMLATLVFEGGGSACPTSGARFEVGPDANGDGTLQPAEATTSTVICRSATAAPGTDPTQGHPTLMRIVAAAAGTACPNGGTTVTSGTDSNTNGVLDGGEVAATVQVCNPADYPAVRMRASAEPPGSSCSAGGVRIDAGVDADGDGALADGEVQTTYRACDNAAGTPAMASLAFEPAGANCATSGARFQAGLDTDSDGTLKSTETGFDTYVCQSSLPAAGTDPSRGQTTLMRVALEASGTVCPFGGDLVTSGRDANGNGALDAVEIEATMHVCSEATANPLPWSATVDSAVQAVANTGLVALSDTAEVVVSLPDTLQIGDIIAVAGRGAGGWRLAQAAGQSVNAAPVGAVAGLAWTPHESARNWGGIATSSDGRKLVAADFSSGGRLHLSSDAGLTWTEQGSPLSWWGVASSSDGTRLAAAEYTIQTSTDSGANWTARAAPVTPWWISIASSADGTRLAANISGGQIYTSSDAGLTWTARASVQSWNAIASSASGNRLVAAGYGTQIYTSADGGTTWVARESVRDWESVASSADGLRLAAVARDDQIFLSNDAGATWTVQESARTWLSIACSDDCSTLVAVADGGQIHLSTDSGATWVARDTNRHWYWAASSADGSRLVALDYGGRIYTSSSWTTIGPAGSLSGGAADAVELQYAGNGNFTVLRHVGTIGVQ
jgi:hypothetical protein